MVRIQGIEYDVLDVYNESITLPDSFTVQGNKYGKGHGEAKLYVGGKVQMNSFFGNDTHCFVLKKDFDDYRKSLISAQTVLTSIYKKSISGNTKFNVILGSIDSIIKKLNNKEDFHIKLMNNLNGHRGYINSTSKSKKNGYYYLRACCIPFVSFIRILKLQETQTGNISFYMKLFPNFDEMYKQIQYIKSYGKRVLLNKPNYRPGQSKYKKDLVAVFHECVFTHIQDERLLIASHIQPFASCTKQQQYDINNGLLLSPLYDRLFDRGFITFDQQGTLKKSIWLSPTEWNKIPLDYTVQNLNLTPERKKYLLFHETHVFLGD